MGSFKSNQKNYFLGNSGLNNLTSFSLNQTTVEYEIYGFDKTYIFVSDDDIYFDMHIKKIMWT